MMQKIVTLSVDELRFDAGEVAETLLHACTRGNAPLEIRGMCQIDESVFFTLLPCRDAGSAPAQYVWVEIRDRTDDGVASLLEERWAAGFDLIGSVNADADLSFLLFVKNPEGVQ